MDINVVRANNPGKRFALGCNGSMLGQWTGERFYPIASQTITGQWVRMDYAIKINGAEPIYEWKE